MANQSQHQQNQITSLASTLSPLLPTSTHPSLSNSVIPSLLASLQTVASALRDSQKISQAGTANAFGDEQLNVDVQAENAIRAALAACPAVVTASSEEDPREVATNPSASASRGAASGEDEEVYTAAFDPLDGSSIIAPNWTVGSIIGLWRGRSALNSSPKENQIASILGVYGPRTTAIVAWRVSPTESRCFEIGLGGSSAADVSCEIVRPEITYASPPFKTRYFAPANLRAASEEPRYASLIQSYISEKYTLRYSGGLVPDVVHALVKGHGVYVSPVTEGCKAKLRRLYELAPLALVVECAGGKAVDSASGEGMLEREVRDCDERGGIVCGNGEEVERVREAFGLK